jgi:hypothetical protein
MFLRNVGVRLYDYTVPHPRRPHSLKSQHDTALFSSRPSYRTNFLNLESVTFQLAFDSSLLVLNERGHAEKSALHLRNFFFMFVVITYVISKSA